MNIGVIGTGDIGEVVIRKLRDAGYPLKMANARGPESPKDLAAKTEQYRLQLNKSFKMSICSSLIIPRLIRDFDFQCLKGYPR